MIRISKKIKKNLSVGNFHFPTQNFFFFVCFTLKKINPSFSEKIPHTHDQNLHFHLIGAASLSSSTLNLQQINNKYDRSALQLFNFCCALLFPLFISQLCSSQLSSAFSSFRYASVSIASIWVFWVSIQKCHFSLISIFRVFPLSLQKIMQEFETQNEKMEMTTEVMGDAIDDALEGDEEEEEIEELVNQVLDEIGIDINQEVLLYILMILDMLGFLLN